MKEERWDQEDLEVGGDGEGALVLLGPKETRDNLDHQVLRENWALREQMAREVLLDLQVHQDLMEKMELWDLPGKEVRL